jgi:SAM-dependent methyltransferase
MPSHWELTMIGRVISGSAIGIRRYLTSVAAMVSGVLVGFLLLRRRNAFGFRWYRAVYWLAYHLGLTVWQRSTPPADLVALLEGPSAIRPGRALDIGCGTGTDTAYLATHGWDVTAIEMVPKALAAARRTATAAGVAPRFIEGDITRMHDLGAGDGYTLLLDFGCFHTLPEDRRPAYITSVSRAAAPGATLLLYGFSRPPRAAPMHAGLTIDEVRQRFSPSGWKFVNAQRASVDTRVRRADERFELWRYQLQRLPS